MHEHKELESICNNHNVDQTMAIYDPFTSKWVQHRGALSYDLPHVVLHTGLYVQAWNIQIDWNWHYELHLLSFYTIELINIQDFVISYVTCVGPNFCL